MNKYAITEVLKYEVVREVYAESQKEAEFLSDDAGELVREKLFEVDKDVKLLEEGS